MTKRKNTGKSIYCEETKMSYPSLKNISVTLNIDYSYLIKCVKSGKICKGYHFKYIDKDNQ